MERRHNVSFKKFHSRSIHTSDHWVNCWYLGAPFNIGPILPMSPRIKKPQYIFREIHNQDTQWLPTLSLSNRPHTLCVAFLTQQLCYCQQVYIDCSKLSHIWRSEEVESGSRCNILQHLREKCVSCEQNPLIVVNKCPIVEPSSLCTWKSPHLS